ncbi:MAG TPA: 50S ribosomal protein L13 [Candidatus Paceibacterota bacterium]|nr:50S ribosomal protein L13 [Candidatus Paceibacterota bacterium]
MAKKEYTIDAINRTVGRVASEAAMLLMGKNSPEYESNIAPKVTVKIINTGKAKIPAAKMKGKEYLRHSQYPGGQKSETMERVVAKFGYGEVFKRAVYGMLPKNKLRAVMIKNLTVSE